MPQVPNSGLLRGLYSFQKKGDTDDGFGGIIPGAGPFAEVFRSAGQMVLYRPGVESIVAGRLNGIQRYILTVRSHIQARNVTVDWRVVDARGTKIYQIKSPSVDTDQKNAYLEFIIEEGGVT